MFIGGACAYRDLRLQRGIPAQEWLVPTTISPKSLEVQHLAPRMLMHTF